MSKVTTVGIDLAKSVFQFHGIDASGEVMLRRQVRRAQMPQMLAQLAPCVVVMEACGGAHYWARLSRELGHTVKLLAPRYVKAFVRGAKNDRNDARAICEAGCQPGMPTVAVKSETQQGCLACIGCGRWRRSNARWSPTKCADCSPSRASCWRSALVRSVASCPECCRD